MGLKEAQTPNRRPGKHKREAQLGLWTDEYIGVYGSGDHEE